MAVACCWARPEAPPPDDDGYRFELTHVDAGRGFSDDVLMQRAFERSRRREEALLAAGPVVRSPAELNRKDCEYFMKFKMGTTKQVPISALVDTGSNLIWTSNKKCQDSDTLTNLPCGARCQHANCVCQSNKCTYSVKYGSNARWSTAGVLRRAKLTFQLAMASGGGTKSFDDVAVGCSTIVDFPDSSVTGIVGLGRGAQSLHKQLKEKQLIKSGNFAYCLSAYTKPDRPSVLLLGASKQGGVVTTTGLRKNPSYESFYFVQLDSISIGGTQLPIDDLKQQGDGGNMFVDSGASFTFLVDKAYDEVVKKVDEIMAGKQRTRLGLDKTNGRICYQGAPDETMPDMVLHFAGGADMVLPWRSYLWESTTGPSLCLAFQKTTKGPSILGNFQQQGMHMHFDMEKEEMSFVRADCSKL
ncbi:unnamed protein product [Urochloa decumbens]|uniref:Peptidase A1 domain-containing protein n=1 Tax=Urochloa decumbens TaxID=240449 RepID=A0ABC9C8V1_9POAL